MKRWKEKNKKRKGEKKQCGKGDWRKDKEDAIRSEVRERETKSDGHRALQALVKSRRRQIGEWCTKYKMSQCSRCREKEDDFEVSVADTSNMTLVAESASFLTIFGIPRSPVPRFPVCYTRHREDCYCNAHAVEWLICERTTHMKHVQDGCRRLCYPPPRHRCWSSSVGHT